MVRFKDARNRIRDPLHGDIVLTNQELEIVKNPNFQRLKYVRQLPTAYMVYPGAMHSRYLHSLGVLQVATNISMEMGLDEEDIEILRIACLLHDITELPFERVFEEYYIFPEEEIVRKEVVQRICKEIHADWPLVWAMLDSNRAGKRGVRYLYQILYSDLGANQIDYLRRDSFSSGVNYGLVDERIYSAFVLDKENDEILIKWPHLTVIESLFTGVYQLKHSVYDHKMVRSALSLIRKAVFAYLERRSNSLRKLLVNEESDNGERWVLRTDSQLLNELRKEDRKSIGNFENGKLPRDIYDLDFYGLKDAYKHPEILASFESLRLSAPQIDKEIQNLCSLSFKPSFDVVSVISLSKGVKALRVLKRRESSTSLRTTLFEVSPILNRWSQYFLEQWKLYLFSESNSTSELREARKKCRKIFDFLTINSKKDLPEEDFMLPSLSELYQTVRSQREITMKDKEIKEITSTFRDRILALSNERREILSILCNKKQATASEIASIRGTKRETNTALLRKLENDSLILKRKISKKVYYFPRKEVEAALRSLRSDLPLE